MDNAVSGRMQCCRSGRSGFAAARGAAPLGRSSRARGGGEYYPRHSKGSLRTTDRRAPVHALHAQSSADADVDGAVDARSGPLLRPGRGRLLRPSARRLCASVDACGGRRLHCLLGRREGRSERVLCSAFPAPAPPFLIDFSVRLTGLAACAPDFVHKKKVCSTLARNCFLF